MVKWYNSTTYACIFFGRYDWLSGRALCVLGATPGD